MQGFGRYDRSIGFNMVFPVLPGKKVQPVQGGFSARENDMIGGTFPDYFVHFKPVKKLKIPGIFIPGIFCIAPGTGEIAGLKADEQTFYTGEITFSLDGFEILGDIIDRVVHNQSVRVDRNLRFWR